MGVAAHCIDTKSSLKSVVLDFHPLKGSYTSDVLVQAFFKVMCEQYNLKLHHGAITLDNATNNDKFIELYTDMVEGWFSPAKHIRCFAHVLNLAVGEAVSSIQASLTTLRAGIRMIRYSPKRLDHLERICSQL